jgi:hypothetical protein
MSQADLRQDTTHHAVLSWPLHLHLPTLIRDDAAHLGPISRPHLFCSVVQTKVYSFTEIKLRKADILGLSSALIPPFANDGLSGARPAQASTDRPGPLDFTCDLTRPAARHVKTPLVYSWSAHSSPD